MDAAAEPSVKLHYNDAAGPYRPISPSGPARRHVAESWGHNTYSDYV